MAADCQEHKGPYPPESYRHIGLDQLLVFSVKRILDSGEQCSFERLVYECFSLFPDKFGMQRYPEWPDSARVNKSWLRCRTDKGWIEGSAQRGFTLTAKGEQVAATVAMSLGHSIQKVAQKSMPRGTEDAVLKWIRRHPTFDRWTEDPHGFRISPIELRDLLNATMETPVTRLRENLHNYKNIAKTMGDRDVEQFLGVCENQHQQLLRRPMRKRRKNGEANLGYTNKP
ncbi:MAG: hypothetical protein QXQ48_09440 [Nitrososphaerota archaeon]